MYAMRAIHVNLLENVSSSSLTLMYTVDYVKYHNHYLMTHSCYIHVHVDEF